VIIREAIYSALWSMAAGAANFASANRRLRHWADVAAAEQPALFMSEKGGHAVTKALGGRPYGRSTPISMYMSTRATRTCRRQCF
jgi:hypothetical protein